MLNRLQQKWKVNGWRLLLIIATFAIGGSFCGYAGRRLMHILQIDHPILWTIVYLVLITLIWPPSVLLVSIPLGQFPFFKRYLAQIGGRIGILKVKESMNKGDITTNGTLPKIAIFASGTGSNAEKIIESTLPGNASDGVQPIFKVAMVVTNKPSAGVLKIAEKYDIPTLIIEKEQFFRGNAYTDELKGAGVDFIVLAGFLWKIPVPLINAFANRIINIHPALLPNYGGKGMYGSLVHEAVIANGDAESGITIHWVDEHYDNGSIIFQAKCPVLPDDTADSLASRIHELEHLHYPEVVAKLVSALANK